MKRFISTLAGLVLATLYLTTPSTAPAQTTVCTYVEGGGSGNTKSCIGTQAMGDPAAPSTPTNAQQVQGNVASGTTDSGFPAKIGCVYNSTLPTYTTGQRGDVQCNSKGSLFIAAGNAGGAGDGVQASTSLPQDEGGTYRPFGTMSYLFNGASTYRQAGDQTGIWLGGKANLATAQVSVGTSATQVAAARTGRQRLILSVGAANSCYFGPSGVTTTTGFALQPVVGTTVTLQTAAAAFMVCSATTTISVAEEY